LAQVFDPIGVTDGTAIAGSAALIGRDSPSPSAPGYFVRTFLTRYRTVFVGGRAAAAYRPASRQRPWPPRDD
jgi:hypothetical protein